MFTARCSRRRLVALPVAAAAAAAAGACSRGESDPNALTLLAANSPWTEGMKTLATAYERETGIAVRVEAYGNEQLNDTFKVKLNARSADFDLMAYQPQDVIREFTHNGWLADLTARVGADAAWNWQDFQAPAREAVTLDGTVYGVPVMTERHVVYYRSDLLAAANLPAPRTLEELEATAAALHDPDGDLYGIAMRGALVPLVTQFSSFLYSFGGDFQDGDEAALDSPEAIEAYEYYGRLLREYGPPGATNMGWVEAAAIFAQGKAVFYVDADSQAYTFLDESASAVADTVAYARFPAGPAGSRFYNIVPQCVGLNAYSTKQDKAWDFLAWATSEANSKRLLIEETAPPARQSAWDDPESAAAYPAALVEIIREAATDSVAYDRPRLEQVARAREYVGAPAVTAIEGGDVPDAAREANDEFQELLDYER